MDLKSKIKDILRYIHIAILRNKARGAESLDLKGSILILAPHPDDEAIGCGGLIARLCNEGRPPHVAIVTGGGASLHGHSLLYDAEVIDARRHLTLDSAKVLGLPAQNIHFLDFQDGNVAQRPDREMVRLRNLIAEIQPVNILVPHRGEGWADHLEVRKLGIELAPENADIIEYCVWMWYYNVWNLDWENARCVKLDNKEFEAKISAVNAYIIPESPDGLKWSGILPAPFIKANTSRTELYFLLKHDQR